MDKLKRIYSFNNAKLNWAVIGERGGIQVWCLSHSIDCGGVEVHSRSALHDWSNPSHSDCWLTGGACYHDGSSLYYTERVRSRVGWCWDERSFDPLWRFLLVEYKRRFECEAELDETNPPEAYPKESA